MHMRQFQKKIMPFREIQPGSQLTKVKNSNPAYSTDKINGAVTAVFLKPCKAMVFHIALHRKVTSTAAYNCC